MTYDTVGSENKQSSNCRGTNLLYETGCLTHLYFRTGKEGRRGDVIGREEEEKLFLQFSKLETELKGCAMLWTSPCSLILLKD